MILTSTSKDKICAIPSSYHSDTRIKKIKNRVSARPGSTLRQLRRFPKPQREEGPIINTIFQKKKKKK